MLNFGCKLDCLCHSDKLLVFKFSEWDVLPVDNVAVLLSERGADSGVVCKQHATPRWDTTMYWRCQPTSGRWTQPSVWHSYTYMVASLTLRLFAAFNFTARRKTSFQVLYMLRQIPPFVCPSFCPSITLWYCVRMRERRGMQSSPSGSPLSLVFWRQEWLMGDNPVEVKF